MGEIDGISDTELLEYQDIVDFLTVYHANKEKVKMYFLNNKVKEIGLLSTLNKLLSIKF